MHRELKIGLAVGVLLVGIVAAFFFRRHDDPELEIEELENTAELDADVAEQPGAPYLQRVEADDEGYAYGGDDEDEAYGQEDGDDNGWNVAGADSDGGSSYESSESSEDNFLNDRDEELFHEFSRDTGTPEPIRTTQTRSRERDDDIPEENRHWRNVDDDESSYDRDDDQDRRTNEERTARSTRSTGTALTHTIRSGDTLSAISARYLGTSRRFQEIYKANRDVLKSPNRLPLGVTITIPGKGRNESVAEEPDRSRRTTRTGTGRARLLNNSETETRARFTPAGRNAPFLPARSSESRGSRRRTSSRDRAEETDRIADDRPRTYTVRSGDTLEGIARRIYGSRKKADSILRANRHQLRSPRSLRPGMELTLP